MKIPAVLDQRLAPGCEHQSVAGAPNWRAEVGLPKSHEKSDNRQRREGGQQVLAQRRSKGSAVRKRLVGTCGDVRDLRIGTGRTRVASRLVELPARQLAGSTRLVLSRFGEVSFDSRHRLLPMFGNFYGSADSIGHNDWVVRNCRLLFSSRASPGAAGAALQSESLSESRLTTMAKAARRQRRCPRDTTE